ncbi:MAG: alpha-amylase family protein [Planctomycetota bacterium]
MTEKIQPACGFRAYQIDNHSPGPEIIDYSNFDPKYQLDIFKRACVDTIQVYAKDHWGYSYYPTRVGTIYPGLKHDVFGGLMNMAHKEGFKTMGYYCISFDCLAGSNKAWSVKDYQGKALRFFDTPPNYTPWRLACFNTGYRDYVMSQIKEMVSWYPMDMLFLDILIRPAVCFCDDCKRLYKKDTGRKIPAPNGFYTNTKDVCTSKSPKQWTDAWKQFIRWNYTQTEKFIKEIRSIVRKTNPGIHVTINNTASWSWPAFMANRIKTLDLCDSIFSECHEGANIITPLVRALSGTRPFQIATGKFSGIYDPRPANSCQLEMDTILAHGGKIFIFSETMRKDGMLDSTFFDTLKPVFTNISKKERFLEGLQFCHPVGIVYSETSRVFYGQDDFKEKYAKSMSGAVKFCAKAHLPAEILLEEKLSGYNLNRFELLLLPNTAHIKAKHIPILEQFVSKGGKILATYHTGLFDRNGCRKPESAMAGILGAKFVKDRNDYILNPYSAYINLKQNELNKQGRFSYVGVKGGIAQINPTTAATLAKYTWPILKERREGFINWGPPHPGRDTDIPAIIENKAGNGTVIYLSFPCFKLVEDGLNWPQEILEACTQRLVPEPSLTVEAPDFVEATFAWRKNTKALVVQLLNHSVANLNGRINPVKKADVLIHRRFGKIADAEMKWPKQKKLPVKVCGNYHQVTVSNLDISAILYLNLDVLHNNAEHPSSKT